MWLVLQRTGWKRLYNENEQHSANNNNNNKNSDKNPFFSFYLAETYRKVLRVASVIHLFCVVFENNALMKKDANTM